MCLAIYKPADTEIPEEYLRNGYSNHSDGAGLAWAVDGVLHLKKGIFDVEEVIKQYRLVKQYPCLIHFRKATHGKINEDNCHPFLFNDNKLALVHNGILPIKCNIDGLSDTFHFVKLVLEPMVRGYNIPINDGALNYLITTSIGTDKIAIMDGTGKTYIFNEGKGEWKDGVWYSNSSFSWEYSKTTGFSGGQSSYYSNRTNGSHIPPATYDTHKNWKKNWENTSEADDESYLEFWKRATDEMKEDASKDHCSANCKSLTQKIPLLLKNKDTVDDAGNVNIIDVEEVKTEKETFGPGHMCEYGWWDEDIEEDIKLYMKNSGVSREEAIIRVFNEK